MKVFVWRAIPGTGTCIDFAFQLWRKSAYMIMTVFCWILMLPAGMDLPFYGSLGASKNKQEWRG